MGIESEIRFNNEKNEEKVKKTIDAEKRYEFYYAKKPTKGNPILSEKKII